MAPECTLYNAIPNIYPLQIYAHWGKKMRKIQTSFKKEKSKIPPLRY